MLATLLEAIAADDRHGTPRSHRSSTKLCPWLRPALEQLEAAARQRDASATAGCSAGPAGVGKINLALVFAARLLTRDPAGPPAELGPARPSPRSASGTYPADHHPDLHWLFPEEDKRAISIEQIREPSRRRSSLKSHRGEPRSSIIEPADAMTAAAANALLKTLEEPSGDTYLLLLSQQPEPTAGDDSQPLPTARDRGRQARDRAGLARRTRSRSLASAWLLTGGAPLLDGRTLDERQHSRKQ